MKSDFQIGDYVVRPQLNLVQIGDVKTHLEHKIMSVLVYLATHPGELLSKEQLLQAVWPDTFVTDHVLTNAISEIRKALGDDPHLPRVIQTIPREGYRLLETVKPLERGGDETPKRARFWLLRVALVAAIAVVFGYLVSQWFAAKKIDSVAVLAIENETGNEEHDPLCFGMTERIAHRLGKFADLKVVNSFLVVGMESHLKDPRVLAAELGVGAFLQGNLYEHGDEFALHLNLVDTQDGQILWGDSFDFVLKEVVLVQKLIAAQVVQAIESQVAGGQRSLQERPYTEDPLAEFNYFKGLFHYEHGINDVEEFELGMQSALRYFQRAVEIDPDFALAYVGQARVYEELGWSLTSKDYYEKSAEASRKALEVDRDLAEVQAQIAWIRARYDGDWKGGEEIYELARSLDPNCLTPPYFYLWQGRMAEAREAIRKEIQQYDPLSPERQRWIAAHCYIARDFDSAIERARMVLELDPNRGDVLKMIASCLVHKSRREEAFETYIEARSLQDSGTVDTEKLEHRYSSEGWQGIHRLEAEEYLCGREDNQFFQPLTMAMKYARAEDRENALDWLEEACKLPVYLPFTTHPDFDCIRGEPRYRALLERLNLDPRLADRFQDQVGAP